MSRESSKPHSALHLYLTVIISGGAVMILELLGTRIIGPFYGVSLYVWSSLIAVTLIALAVGYYLGGYIADRYAAIRLPHVILIGALSSVIIPYISSTVLTLTDPLGIRVGGFVSALLLFTLPLTCLAMVGPFVIKQATHDLDGVGRAAGSVYAVSTLGSVVGTLLLGFYLLPHFGTRAIIFTLAAILVGLALLLAWRDRQVGVTTLATGLPALLLAVLISTLAVNGYAQPREQVAGFKLLHEEESIYGWVRVVEDENKGARLLLSDSSVLSAMQISNGQSMLGYQIIFRLIPGFRPQSRDSLLIGLGGGQVARDLRASGINVDTIEIDPAVASAAKEYFGFKPTGEFIVGDARYEIKNLSHKRYDFIMHDCFTGGSEPTHLLTLEMLSKLRDLLKGDGVLALNYVGFREGDGADAVASVYKTVQSLFPHIRIITTVKEDFTDFVFLASAKPLDLPVTSPDPRVKWLLEHEHHMSSDGGILITDDYNPMERLQVRKAESYRKVFMERLDYQLLIL